MLLANFNGKEHLRHRAVSLRQHGFLVLLEFELAVFVLAYFFTFYFLLYFFDRHHVRGYCPVVTCSLEITVSALYIAMLSANKWNEMKHQCEIGSSCWFAVDFFAKGLHAWTCTCTAVACLPLCQIVFLVTFMTVHLFNLCNVERSLLNLLLEIHRPSSIIKKWPHRRRRLNFTDTSNILVINHSLCTHMCLLVRDR